jgi:hypothetical protein
VEPMVDEPAALAVDRGLDAAATVVPDDQDMFDVQRIDGEQEHREVVGVLRRSEVGDVAVHEQFARIKPDDLVGLANRLLSANDWRYTSTPTGPRLSAPAARRAAPDANDVVLFRLGMPPDAAQPDRSRQMHACPSMPGLGPHETRRRARTHRVFQSNA